MTAGRWFLIGLLALVSAGCAAAPTAGPAKPPAVDVTGIWEGMWVSSYPGERGSAILTLQQSGANVTGDLRVTGTQATRPDGPVTGTVSDNVFIFRNLSGVPISAELTVRGDEMSGPYSSVGVGTYTLRRKR